MYVGSLFTQILDEKTVTHKYLVGRCSENITEEGLPGWLWSTLDSENGQINFQNFQTGKIPNCGE